LRIVDPAGRLRAILRRTDGAVVARATTPPGFQPMHITEGQVIGRAMDSLDVEFIRVYRLVRSIRSGT
jgi:hypothetical protein